MASQNALFHAYLRPSILQILRATGYHATSPAVLDCITDLAARYLCLLSEKTAAHAVHAHGDAGDYTLVEIRMAMQEAGAVLPERLGVEEMFREEEDLRGVEEFVRWFSGGRMKEIMEFALGDGETDDMDYLNALKKRHNKTSDDSKFQGTILGKPNDSGEIEVEGGGELKSINDWVLQRSGPPPSTPPPTDISAIKINGIRNGGRSSSSSPTLSSGLSSLGDRLEQRDDQEMDLT